MSDKMTAANGSSEGVTCLHCGQRIIEEPISDRDVWTFTRHRPSPAGIAAIHVACSADGVRRWCRENRPHGSPLEAARAEAWRFTRQTGDSHPFGRPGHTVRLRLRDARQGRLKFAPDPLDG